MRFVSPIRISIGPKVVVALTGLALAGFVLFHMFGNLQVFEGRDALNAYAAFLRDMPMLLWAARATLLALACIHVTWALKLARQNRQARPVGYAVREYRRASLASRTMTVTGLLLLLFIIFHLLHLTAGIVDPSFPDQLDAHGRRDVYGNVIHTFRSPLFVTIYLVAQVVLGLHLSHAVSSSFQTLGVEHPAINRLFQATGPAVAWVVVLGNAAIVLAVFGGLVGT